MSIIQCEIPCALDREISKIMKTVGYSMSPKKVANLRSAYNFMHPDSAIKVEDSELSSMNEKGRNDFILSSAIALMDTENKNIKLDDFYEKKQRLDTLKNLPKSIKKYTTYAVGELSAQQVCDRANMIKGIFREIVDRIQVETGLSRKSIINGTTIDGKNKYGLFYILEEVRNEMQKKASNNPAFSEEYHKLLENAVWNGVVPLAIREISKIEDGLSLRKLCSDKYDAQAFNVEESADDYNSGETVREHWQTVSGMIDSHQSAPALVRSILDRLPNVEVDDLGYPKQNNTARMLANLHEICRGCRNSEEMMNMIESSKWEYKDQLLKFLADNDKLQTTFFKAAKKSFIEYVKVSLAEKVGNTAKTAFNFLNRGSSKTYYKLLSSLNKDNFYGELVNAVSKELQLFKDNSKESVSVRENYIKLLKDTFENTRIPEQNSLLYRMQYANWGKMNKDLKIKFIQDMCSVLGVTINNENAEHILKSGQVYVLKDKILELINFVNEHPRNTLFQHLHSTNTQSDIAKSIFRKALEIVDSSTEKGTKRAVRTKNDKGKTITMFSDTNSSFLTNLYEDIHKFLDSENYEGLREYLEKKYLNSSSFRDGNGRILNTWIRELYDNCDKPDFDLDTWKITRVLTINDDVVEDAYRKNQHIMSFTAFMQGHKPIRAIDRKSFESSKANNKLLYNHIYKVTENNGDEVYYHYSDGEWIKGENHYAYYPVFTLGDNGGAFYIKNKKRTKDEIAKCLVNTFYSEIARMKSTVLVNEQLRNEKYQNHQDPTRGNGLIDNISNKEYIFTMLPFLNDPEYSSIIFEEGVTLENFMHNNTIIPNIREKIEKAILKYLNDVESANLKKLKDDGFLVKDNKGAYTYLDKYIKEYTGNDRIDPNSQEYEDAAMQIISDYEVNNIFSNIQQFQIHLIDLGFVKNSDDLQKRYKAMMASGISLDITAKWNGEKVSDGIERVKYIHDPKSSAEETNKEFADAIAYQYGMATEEFRTLVANEKITAENEKEEAIRCGKKTGVYKKYSKNPIADGQGWRSFTGYRKVMIMSDQWSDELENLYQSWLEYRRTKDEKYLEPLKQSMAALQPIKPLLMDVEDIKLEEDGTMFKVPVFHKYAEIPLIPELLPKGSALREMAEYMEDSKVDMIGVWSDGGDKIAKIGGFGSVDANSYLKNGNVDGFRTALSDAYTHKLHYENYVIQTNVPNHSIDFRAVGTQIRKLIMSGVSLDPNAMFSNYFPNGKICLKDGELVDPDGDNVSSFYNGLVVEGIIQSLNKLKDELGNGDKEKISEILSELKYANDRDSIDALLYGLNINRDGEFECPLFEGLSEFENASALISYFKSRVLKQQILGGSAVQASSYGICDYQESGDLRYETNEKGNILWAECEIPFDLFYTNAFGEKIRLNYDDYCNEDGTLIEGSTPGVSKLEEEYPGILDIIAYRVPTEQEYSMMNLKVKRFTRPILGGIIKVPAPAVTTAGFDFDIDKLYFIRKEFKSESTTEKRITDWLQNKNNVKDVWESIYSKRVGGSTVFDILTTVKNENNSSLGEELYKYWEIAGLDVDLGDKQDLFNSEIESRFNKQWETYDYNRPAQGQSRVAINNAMFDLMRHRLMDPSTFERRTNPGGFAEASAVAKRFRYINSDALTAESTLQSMSEEADNKDGDLKPNYSPIDPYTQILYREQNQIAAKVIGICANHSTGYSYGCLAHRLELEKGYGISFGKHRAERTDLLNKREFSSVFKRLAELLAASVDAVKDPVLKDLNINTLTVNAAATLVRLGYDFEDIGLLLNQPIIREACELAFSEDISLDRAIKEIRRSEKYKNHKPFEKGAHFDTNLLFEYIKYDKLNPGSSDSNFCSSQLSILDIFEKTQSIAGTLSKFNAAIKNTASNSISSSFGGYYAQKLNLADLPEVLVGSHIIFEKSATAKTNSDNLPIDMESWQEMRDNSKDYFINTRAYRNQFAYEQAMLDAQYVFMEMLNREVFPYENIFYSYSRHHLNRILKYGNLKDEQINNIHKEIVVNYLNGIPGVFNPSDDVQNVKISDSGGNTLIYNNSYFYKYIFPKVVAQACSKNASEVSKNDGLLAYAPVLSENLVNRVKNHTNTLSISDNTLIDTIHLELSEIMQLEKDEMLEDAYIEETITITEQFGDNIESNTINVKMHIADVARGLFLNSFYNNGTNTTAISKFIPKNVLKSIKIDPKNEEIDYTYVDILNMIHEDIDMGSSLIFSKLYILNHSEDRSFVYTPKGKVKKAITPENRYFSITVDLNKNSKNKVNNTEFLLKMPNMQDGEIIAAEYVPCVNIDGTLYMAVSSITSDKMAMEYVSGYSDAALTSKVILDNPEGSLYNIKNRENKLTMYYVQVDKLGVDGKSLNYDINSLNDMYRKEMLEHTVEQHLEEANESYHNNSDGISAKTAEVYTVDVNSVLEDLKSKGYNVDEKTVKEVCDSIQKFKNKRAATAADGKHVVVLDSNGNEIEMC